MFKDSLNSVMTSEIEIIASSAYLFYGRGRWRREGRINSIQCNTQRGFRSCEPNGIIYLLHAWLDKFRSLFLSYPVFAEEF